MRYESTLAGPGRATRFPDLPQPSTPTTDTHQHQHLGKNLTAAQRAAAPTQLWLHYISLGGGRCSRPASRHCAVTTPPAPTLGREEQGWDYTARHTRHYVHYTLHPAPDHCPASPRPRPGRALTSCSASAMVPGSSVPAVSGSRTAVAPPSSVATPKMRKGR